jgi:penicillin amidase/acyl-homoserine-lactone acylase
MPKRFPRKETLAILLGLITLGVIYVFTPEHVDLASLQNAGGAYNARILRDTWGVPHIFGTTDADAAYGLAYAHAEDDFLTIQQTLLAARGRLATVYGPGAAPIDYSIQLLRIWDVVAAKYEALQPASRAVLDGYAAGLNLYAARHAGQVLSAELFPVTGKDIVAASVQKSPLFFGLDGTLSQFGTCGDAASPSLSLAGSFKPADTRFGSNVFALAPGRTADGSTFLAVNSHQPWTGPVAWYEAHIHSEEGWDMVGGTFPATPLIIHGHNRNLGWAFTVNYPDLIDVYALETNPDNANQYRFDGQWRDFEKRNISITVRLAGRIRALAPQTVLWSVHGPVMCKDGRHYAIRYAGFGRADNFEQLYRMNKASNFDEWRAAMSTGALPAFNVGYADREGNVYYLYNANLPIRAEGYDWQGELPGDTSATLWTDYLPFDQLPQVFNPPAGFVINSNSAPFQATAGAGNPEPARYPAAFGIETTLTNRARRALELFGGDEQLTFEQFVERKFDMAYSPESGLARYVREIVEAPLPAPGDPDLAEGVDVLRRWDLRANPENTSTALVMLTLHYLTQANPDVRGSALTGEPVERTQLIESLAKAVRTLKAHFGRLDVPWEQVNRLRRGSVDLGLGGGPDVLHAVYGELQADGRLRGVAGDSYVLLVRWGPQGQVQSFSLHQFGSATLEASSPHYADQAPLFARRELKPVWLGEADIRAHLEREYRPGEEGR